MRPHASDLSLLVTILKALDFTSIGMVPCWKFYGVYLAWKVFWAEWLDMKSDFFMGHFVTLAKDICFSNRYSNLNYWRIPLTSAKFQQEKFKTIKRRHWWSVVLGFFSTFSITILQMAAEFFKNSSKDGFSFWKSKSLRRTVDIPRF